MRNPFISPPKTLSDAQAPFPRDGLLGGKDRFGRLFFCGRGERFAFTRLALDVRCTGGGALLLRVRCDLRPAEHELDNPAILGDAPALRIKRSLLTEDGESGPEYAHFLLRELRVHDLSYVAGLREVSRREKKVRRALENGLKKAGAKARLETGEVAVLDTRRNRKQMISRYAPYYAHPNARYSIGIMRSPDSIGITAMRNPWKPFKSVALGRVFEQFGGGGHQRVGAVRLSSKQSKRVKDVLESLLSKMQKPAR